MPNARRLALLATLIASALMPLRAPAAELDQVARHPQWLRLLHLVHSAQGYDSDILDRDFYLSQALSPRRELAATLALLDGPATPERAAFACRFPARVQWLADQLDRAELIDDVEHCSKLQAWLPDPKQHRLLVVQVSGYFGNPASAFGHLLLRIADKDQAPGRGLLDRGVNFGAAIPPDESTLRYIARGLAGGYRASFTENEHYKQDHVYGANEARDMWAYELNLDDAQLRLLTLHLWELREVEFNYYFLRKNCAWRVAELLALALERRIGPAHQPYYLPDDVFIALESIDAEREGELVAARHFVPSLAYAAANRLGELTPAERTRVERYLSAPEARLLDQASTAELDYLLDLYDHRLARATAEHHAELRTAKLPVLRARLRHNDPARPIPSLPPPAQGLAPRQLEFGRDDRGAEQLAVAAFRYELIDRNRAQLANGALSVGALALERRDGTTRVEQLDIVATTRLGSPAGQVGADRSDLAWRFALALKRETARRLSPTAEIGLGRAHNGALGSLWLFANGALWPERDRAEAWLSAGAALRPANARWSAQLDLHSERYSNRSTRRWSARAELRWRLSRGAALSLVGERDRAKLSLQWRW